MRGYTLVNGIYVENTIFNVEFACDYEKCKGACCYAEVEGVALDGGSLTGEEAKAIRDHRGTLASCCDSSRASLVRAKPVYSSDGKWFVSLDENAECVLLNMKRGTCACKIAHKQGNFPFPIPLACQLYPLFYYVRGGERFLTLMNTFEEMCECGYAKGEREHIRVYEFCKEAVIRGFGEDFYSSLEKVAKEWDTRSPRG